MKERKTDRFDVKRHGVLALWCLLCSACASMTETPEHARPDLPAKTDWSYELSSERSIDLKWWQGFRDRRLNELMEQAITANPNLQVLAARVGVAETQIGQARARLLPVFNVGGRTDTTNISGETSLGTSTKFGTGGDMTWELDVWGKARKGVAAQQAAYAASEADWRAGYLVMASSVAGAYFQVRRSDEQLMRQRNAITRSQTILDIYRRMRREGLIPQTQLDQQQAEINTLNAQQFELERGRALAVNALATLTGQAAGDFQIDDTSNDPGLQPLTVPAGLPAELLNRRPDLVAAEYRLMQAVELQGQAKLAQLPRIGLTGLGGSASMGLSNILQTFTAGLSSVVQFPVFDPNVRAQLRVSKAQVEVAEAQYRASVFSAFEEVENVLVNLASRRRQQQEFVDRRERLRRVNEQNQAQLRLGLISQLDLLQQERTLLEAEQAVLQTRWQLLTDTVSLFKAVGGGWDQEDFTASR